MELSNKKWILRKVDEKKAKIISENLNINLLTAKILVARGLEDLNEINIFLKASLDDLESPFKLKDMDIAVERILKAKKNNEDIVIFGDYDVDGVTSTFILVDFFKFFGIKVKYYLPDRELEGYGITKIAVENLLKKFENKVNLIISVDCGITSIDEVEFIKSKGIDIIITDHHQCKENIPLAHAVINPVRPDCNYPFKKLAGVAIAFKLINALCIKENLGDKFLDYLDIVSIGTVADVAPIIGENRIIVKKGMEDILVTKNLGLKSLMEVSQILDKKMTTYVISFLIAPKINAAGRIGDAKRAVELFLSKDKIIANELAKELFEENKFRQEEELKIINQAVDMIEDNNLLDKHKILVLANEGWHHGIIGIVASKIVEKYYRPCFIFSIDENICKGSARSIEGFNIFEAISFCEDLTLKFGGHKQAAGLSIDISNLESFNSKINLYADDLLDKDLLVEKVKADLVLKKEDINIESVKELEKLEPFGFNNPAPNYIYSKVKVENLKLIGNNKHLKMKIRDGNFLLDAVVFNMADKMDLINDGNEFDIYGNLDINVWNNRENLQLIIKDIKPNNFNSFKYYKSLYIVAEKYGSLNIFKEEYSQKSEIDLINTFEADNEDKILVMVNCLNCFKKIKNMLKWSVKSKDLDINYNSVEKSILKCDIVVNPDYNINNLSNYRYIFFYGCILDRDYFSKINKSFQNRIEIISNHDCNSLYNICKINRNEVAMVYKLLQRNIDDDGIIQIKNIMDFIKNLNLNYFKFNNILKILEELKFLEFNDFKNYNEVSLKFEKSIKKTDLDNSKLYRKLKV
jgi:single-stranded-DNA-specific exonuclease